MKRIFGRQDTFMFLETANLFPLTRNEGLIKIGVLRALDMRGDSDTVIDARVLYGLLYLRIERRM